MVKAVVHDEERDEYQGLQARHETRFDHRVCRPRMPTLTSPWSIT